MSVDGLGAAGAGNADIAALIDAELAQLAADGQALRALLVEDAVVTARVLPSNGLTDLLEIAGRRVAAALPSTVRPGDVLQVRVTGFDGDRILLHIVGDESGASIEPVLPNVPSAAAAAAFVAATTARATAIPPPAAPETGQPAPAPPADAAPPSRVDVPREALPVAVPPAAPGAARAFTSLAARANVQPAAVDEESPADPAIAPARAATTQPPRAAPPMRVDPPPGEATPIEARLAAARTSGGHAPSGGGGFVAPPIVAPKPAAGAPAAAAPRPSPIAAYTEPAALLRALRLPVTPSNIASATLALDRPERLPVALAALEAALPDATADPHVATLRTLLGFVGRIEPQSPVLATQIAAFVEHVVDGAEPKQATLLAARAAGPAAPVPAAVAAERDAALAADLKQTLMTMAADPHTPASLAPSLAGALTALTAVQVHAAQALAANPAGLAFTIPLATPNGPANAHISVKRDASDGAPRRVDPENFRIAFVLETAHYGTVAIDLVTVGREVSVEVRTEATPAMRAFRDALGSLTGRLEALRYRVASAGATVGTTSTVALDVAAPAADPDATVDRSA